MVENYHSSGKVEERIIILACVDVHFDFDEAILTKEAQVILKRSIQILKKTPKARIRVAGYTSASGTAPYNPRLSKSRANAVKKYLTQEGVSITVFVKGLIISGILISQRTYIKEVANAIRNGIGNLNKELAKLFDKPISESSHSANNTKDDKRKIIECINLKNVRIVSQNQIIHIELWCGRIDSVDGFSLGMIESTNS